MNPGYLAADGAHLTPPLLDDLINYAAGRPGSDLTFEGNPT